VYRFKILKKWLIYRFAKIAPTSRIRINLLRKLGARIGRNAEVYEDIVVVNYTDLKHLIIEDNATISPGCMLILSSYHDQSCITNYKKPFKEKIRIKKGAYVGANVTIFPGITIGENSIIGACSLVNKNIPDNSLAYGIPVRIKKLYFKKQVACP